MYFVSIFSSTSINANRARGSNRHFWEQTDGLLSPLFPFQLFGTETTVPFGMQKNSMSISLSSNVPSLHNFFKVPMRLQIWNKQGKFPEFPSKNLG